MSIDVVVAYQRALSSWLLLFGPLKDRDPRRRAIGVQFVPAG